MKTKILKIIVITIIILFNINVFFENTELKAKPPARYGQWVTYAGPSGLSQWWCEESQNIECVVGETGWGYR